MTKDSPPLCQRVFRNTFSGIASRTSRTCSAFISLFLSSVTTGIGSRWHFRFCGYIPSRMALQPDTDVIIIITHFLVESLQEMFASIVILSLGRIGIDGDRQAIFLFGILVLALRNAVVIALRQPIVFIHTARISGITVSVRCFLYDDPAEVVRAQEATEAARQVKADLEEQERERIARAAAAARRPRRPELDKEVR